MNACEIKDSAGVLPVVQGESVMTEFYSGTDEEKKNLPGQASHTSNLALFYDLEKF